MMQCDPTSPRPTRKVKVEPQEQCPPDSRQTSTYSQRHAVTIPAPRTPTLAPGAARLAIKTGDDAARSETKIKTNVVELATKTGTNAARLAARIGDNAQRLLSVTAAESRKSTRNKRALNPRKDQMEISAKPASHDNEMGDPPEDLLRLTDEGMTLVTRLIDKRTPAKTRIQMFNRLMEPDMDTKIRHLAIHIHVMRAVMSNSKDQSDFNKQREIAFCRAKDLARVAVFAGKLAKETAEDLRHLKPPGEESTSSQEESDEEYEADVENIEELKADVKDVEGIGEIEADNNLNITRDFNITITKGLMVECDKQLEQFLRHLKEKLTVEPESFIQVLDSMHLLVSIDLLDQLKGLIEEGMGKGWGKDQGYGLQ
jgi:hypothetical protein